MTTAHLAEKLRALATAPAEADLAELLGVRPDEITLGPGVLVVAGESIDLADAYRALNQRLPDADGGARTVTIGDLCPTSSAS